MKKVDSNIFLVQKTFFTYKNIQDQSLFIGYQPIDSGTIEFILITDDEFLFSLNVQFDGVRVSITKEKRSLFLYAVC